MLNKNISTHAQKNVKYKVVSMNGYHIYIFYYKKQSYHVFVDEIGWVVCCSNILFTQITMVTHS